LRRTGVPLYRRRVVPWSRRLKALESGAKGHRLIALKDQEGKAYIVDTGRSRSW